MIAKKIFGIFENLKFFKNFNKSLSAFSLIEIILACPDLFRISKFDCTLCDTFEEIVYCANGHDILQKYMVRTPLPHIDCLDFHAHVAQPCYNLAACAPFWQARYLRRVARTAKMDFILWTSYIVIVPMRILFEFIFLFACPL